MSAALILPYASDAGARPNVTIVARGAGASSMPGLSGSRVRNTHAASSRPPWADLMDHLDEVARSAPIVIGPWTRDDLYER